MTAASQDVDRKRHHPAGQGITAQNRLARAQLAGLPQVNHTIDHHREHLLKPHYHAIVDNPWETVEDKVATARLFLQIPHPFMLCLASLTLFPGTEPRRIENVPVSLFMDPDFVAPIVVFLTTDEAQDITGRYFYASGGDLCIYAQPLQLPGGAHIFTRKIGKWTIDELSEVIPPLLGLG